MKKVTKVLAVVLSAAMVVSMAACGSNPTKPTTAPTQAPGTTASPAPTNEPAEVPTYTYNTYSSALGTKWNPHNWDTSADDTILGYLSSPFCTMQIKDSENGVYQWVYEMATYIKDVTADHKDDITKYNATLADGITIDTVKGGYVFEIGLNKDAKWEDGTPINADTYIYSMKALLDPKMKNYRANLYYSGESAVAGGYDYYNSESVIYTCVHYTATGKDTDLQALIDAGQLYINLSSTDYELYSMSLAGLHSKYGVGDSADYTAISDQANAFGYTKVTNENKATVFKLIDDLLTGLFGVDAADCAGIYNEALFFSDGSTSAKVEFDKVGCYKVDDYTIRYVTQTQQDLNYFLTSCTSTWLVYEKLYEAGKDTTGELVTTDYMTSMATSISYGPYKLASLQEGKQIVFVKNENWYGYTQKDGRLVSETPYEVDGKHVQRYMTDKVVINVMDDAAAKQAFLKGELDDWAPSADDLLEYATSEQLYKVDETYTMSYFFNTNVEKLKEMDNSKGNKNSVVLSNNDFRKAMSLCIDRTEYVSATSGYKPAYATMNSLYFYDVYNDPNSSYRGSNEAMQAICNLYGVEYGEGKAYKTLKEAYQSINGYNLTEAKALMKKACEALVAAGLYTAGEEIVVNIGWAKGNIQTADNSQVALLNKYVNAALEGSGFGKITFEAKGNITDRYGDTAKGEYAIGYGAWGGAAFYPFRNFQVYCDPSQYTLHEGGCWDPTSTDLTLVVKGEEVTMTWQQWSGSLIGNGKYANEGFDVKLSVTAQMEEAWLKLYYRIPLCSTTSCSMLSYKASYYTEDYNIMYGFGGLELMQYNYSDAEWAKYIKENTLNYK